MNKKISFPIAIIIILVCAVLVGGLAVWCYLCIPKAEIPTFKPAEKTPPAAETADWKTYREELGKYLHKDAILEEGITPMMRESGYDGISARDAIAYALQHLEAKGIRDIEICELAWIAAPLSGYLIDGKGSFYIEDKHYSTFRIGVRDGHEGNIGTEFVFITRGEDDKGNIIWYPDPEGEVSRFAYEFLGVGGRTWDEGKERFEGLSSWCK